MGATSWHPLLTAMTFGMGLHHFDVQVEAGEAHLAVLTSYVAS